MADITYVPELDDGEQLNGCSFSGAFMWVPACRVPNKDALLEFSVVTSVNARTGNVTSVSLAEERGDYLVMARHLFHDWADKVGEIKTPEFKYEDANFTDTIRLRDETQERAWGAFSTTQNGILNLACGKGKTVLALKKIASLNKPALVIVNNSGLMAQWVSQAETFLKLDKSQIGVVQQKKAQWDRPLVVAMIHTLAKRADQIPMEIRQRFGVIIFDEAHHVSASTFVKVASLFYGQRYGLTATAEREDGLEPVYYAHLGNVFYSDLVGDLKAKVYFKQLATKVDLNNRKILDARKEFSLGKFYTYLASMRSRNLVILSEVKKALSKGRKILVLTHSAEHPEILRALAKLDSAFAGISLGCVSGDTDGSKRVKIIEDSQVTFASFQIAREGLDAPYLDTVLFVTPFKAWGSLQQGIGRVERRAKDKRDPVAIIFEDVEIPPARNLCRSMKRSLRLNGYSHKDLA